MICPAFGIGIGIYGGGEGYYYEEYPCMLFNGGIGGGGIPLGPLY